MGGGSVLVGQTCLWSLLTNKTGGGSWLTSSSRNHLIDHNIAAQQRPPVATLGVTAETNMRQS